MLSTLSKNPQQTPQTRTSDRWAISNKVHVQEDIIHISPTNRAIIAAARLTWWQLRCAADIGLCGTHRMKVRSGFIAIFEKLQVTGYGQLTPNSVPTQETGNPMVPLVLQFGRCNLRKGHQSIPLKKRQKLETANLAGNISSLAFARRQSIWVIVFTSYQRLVACSSLISNLVLEILWPVTLRLLNINYHPIVNWVKILS
jgi:hypothetical protein